MHHRHFKRVGATALLATAGLLGSLLIAPAAPAATINACQQKKGGTIRDHLVQGEVQEDREEDQVEHDRFRRQERHEWIERRLNGTNGAAGTTGLPGQPQTSFAVHRQR